MGGEHLCSRGPVRRAEGCLSPHTALSSLAGGMCPFRHISGEKTVVCKHWLRGLCKKGDQCEFLHEYDMTKMPECYFYSKFGKEDVQASPPSRPPASGALGRVPQEPRPRGVQQLLRCLWCLLSPVFPASHENLGQCLPASAGL